MCKQRFDKILPLVDTKELEDDEKIFGESYDSEEDGQTMSDHQSDIQVQ